MTVTDGSANTGNTTLTSVTGGFTALMVGNVLTLTQGATFRGHWQIVAFTDANTVTLDRNGPVTAANHTVKVGGALSVTNTGFSPQSTSTTNAVVAGQKIWMQYGAYAPVTNDLQFGASSCNGTVSNPIVVEGYHTTRGDITLDPSLARPTITPVGGAAVPLSLAGTHWIVRGLEAVGTGTSSAAIQFETGANNCVVENCVARAGASSIGVNITGTKNTLRACYVIGGATASDAVSIGGTAPHTVCYNRITCTVGNTFSGVLANVGGNIHHNIIQNFSYGMLLLSATVCLADVESNTFYANGVGIQFRHANQGPLSARVHANVFVNNTTYDVEHNSADYSGLARNAEAMQIQFDCNFFKTSGTRYKNLNIGTNDITLTVDPFTSAATGDFSLNSAAGGGAVVRANPCVTHWADGINTTTLYAGISGTPAGSTGLTSMRDLWRELTGEKDTVRVPNATVDLYLQSGLEALNRRVGYHLTDDTTTIALVNATAEYTLPTDCVEVVFVEHNSMLLDKSDLAEWRRQGINWRASGTNKSSEWAMYANKLVLYPRPNAAMVAEASACTIRYISTPPSITTYGAEQLGTQDYRVIVYYGVAEWSRSYPDSAFAVKRADDYQAKFEAEAQLIARNYSDRGVSR